MSKSQFFLATNQKEASFWKAHEISSNLLLAGEPFFSRTDSCNLWDYIGDATIERNYRLTLDFCCIHLKHLLARSALEFDGVEFGSLLALDWLYFILSFLNSHSASKSFLQKKRCELIKIVADAPQAAMWWDEVFPSPVSAVKATIAATAKCHKCNIDFRHNGKIAPSLPERGVLEDRCALATPEDFQGIFASARRQVLIQLLHSTSIHETAGVGKNFAKSNNFDFLALPMSNFGNLRYPFLNFWQNKFLNSKEEEILKQKAEKCVSLIKAQLKEPFNLLAGAEFKFQWDSFKEKIVNTANHIKQASFLSKMMPVSGVIIPKDYAGEVAAFCAAFRKHNIPTFSFTHWGFNFMLGYSRYTQGADVLLHWNKLDLPYFKKKFPERKKLYAIGCLRKDFSSILNNTTQKKDIQFPPRILILTSMISYGMALPICNPQKFLKSIDNLYDFIISHRDWQFILKPHHTFDHWELYNRKFAGLENVVFWQDSLEKAVRSATAVCLFNTTSTAATEPIKQHKPVCILTEALLDIPSHKPIITKYNGIKKVKNYCELEKWIFSLKNGKTLRALLQRQTRFLKKYIIADGKKAHNLAMQVLKKHIAKRKTSPYPFYETIKTFFMFVMKRNFNRLPASHSVLGALPANVIFSLLLELISCGIQYHTPREKIKKIVVFLNSAYPLERLINQLKFSGEAIQILPLASWYIASQVYSKTAVFGAGKYTARLLAEIKKYSLPLPVAIYDDNPPAYFPYPVISSSKLLNSSFDAIVVGTDAWQNQMIKRIHTLLKHSKKPHIIVLDKLNLLQDKDAWMLKTFFKNII
jgi:hypothetical protein